MLQPFELEMIRPILFIFGMSRQPTYRSGQIFPMKDVLHLVETTDMRGGASGMAWRVSEGRREEARRASKSASLTFR